MPFRKPIARWLGGVTLAFFVGAVVAASGQPKPEALVYKSRSCGCCIGWVRHLEEHGFEVETIDTGDMNAVKKRVGLPLKLASCHTAIVNGRYVVEGHVPAAEILKLVESGADIKGLAVPGMPGGSPGMESAPAMPYDVIAFDADGNTEVYAKYGDTAREQD